MLRAPFSSEFDPSEEAEGSIDPLGLQLGYERLADRLLPAVTVRMGRPRFVTAMAVGARVCESWNADEVSSDGVTPPWLVWEWFLIEAFYRKEELLAEKSSIPGIQKVRRAIRSQRPVSSATYLKTPGTFGFTGIFRRLTHRVDIISEDGRLVDGGYELLTAWAKDQGLDGFVDASSGDGHDLRERIRRAVSHGMQKGQTTWQPTEFWRDLTQRLDPARPGIKEAKVLLARILSHKGAGNPAMIECMRESLVAQGGVSGREGEAPFLRNLSDHAPADLKQLLTAIDAYEAFGRAITDAFDSLRHCSSINGGAPVDVKEFSAAKATRTAFKELGPSLARIRRHPTLLEWIGDESGLCRALERFEAVRTVADMFDAILDHHKLVQDNKPPGKRTWFERTLRNKALMREGHELSEPPEGKGSYVHEYRIPTFSRFLADLGAYR